MQKVYKLLMVSILLLSSVQAKALEATGSDSRIRTMIYGQNDVFRINSTYGFQTVIEFDPAEKILTISVGNPSLFKIIPSGNRLFIKALLNGQLTNMTVVTDLRTYQIELASSTENPDDIMYVVRFLYPDKIAADETGSKPMSLYSPIKLGPDNISSMPAVPSFNQVPSVSQIVGGPAYGGVSPPDVPLSIQYNKTGSSMLPEINVNK
jgi:hypothetical protein